MKTVQMTLDKDLVEEVDWVAKKLKTTCSAFARKALREAVAKFNVIRLQRKHRQGYQAHPVAGDEFGV